MSIENSNDRGNILMEETKLHDRRIDDRDVLEINNKSKHNN
jgi:hypothetical protein